MLPTLAVTPVLGVALALAALVAAPGSAGRPSKGPIVAFVSAEDDDALVVVEPVGGRVLRRLAVANGPHNVAASRVARFALVTSPPAGKVTLLDGRTLAVLKVFSGLGSPHDVEVGPRGWRAYVTEEGRGRVTVLDLPSRQVVSSIPVGPRPHDLAVAPDGRRLWVTHGPRQREITIVDPVGARVVRRIDAGGPAHDISFSPGGHRVWVTYWNFPRVGAFSVRAERLLFQARVGRLPHHVAVDWARVYVTDHQTGLLHVLSSGDGHRLRSLPLGPGPHHVAFMERSFVAGVSHDAGTLSTFDVGGRKVSAIRVGRGLHGVALSVRS